MSRVVCFKQLNGQEIVGKLNDSESVRAEYAHIPNVVVLDDALAFHVQVVQAEGGPKAQVSFNPVSITAKSQGPSRIAFCGSLLVQIELDESYEAGYMQATSSIVVPNGGRLIV